MATCWKLCFYVWLMLAAAVAGSAQQQRRPDDGDSTNQVDVSGKKGVYKLEGPNVCRKLQRIPKQVTVPERVPVSVRKTTWCLQIPPNCETSETVYRMIYTTKTEFTEDMIDTCCSGYYESGGRCLPHCTPPCFHGQCVRPDTCECEPGYSGPSCSTNCPRDRWGPNCTRTCTCLNGGKCDAVDGFCECTPGWRSENCSQPCAPFHYGHMCMLQCRCLHGADCDHISGECKCLPGYCGPLCEREEPHCPAGESRTCDKCQNGGKCRRDNSCDCPAGYTGEVCANVCPSGKWGDNCRQDCPVCYNNGTCDRITGKCVCPAGFQGSQCQMQCMKGFYGPNCDQVCKCENDAVCDFDTGKCECTRGFSGEFCEIRACPAGRFDPSTGCSKRCTCGNATLCHPISGACTCAAGWRDKLGDSCCTCCILNGEDTACLHRCKCMDRKFLCDPDLDGCVCMPWYKGTPDECSALINLASHKVRDEVALAGASHHDPNSGGSSFGVILAVIAAVLLVLFGALAFIYRRRRRLRAAKYADADFSVTYSPGSEFNLHENPRLNRSISAAPSAVGRSDSIVDNPSYTVSPSVIAEAPAFRTNRSDAEESRGSMAVPPSASSAEPVFHGLTADVPNNKRTMPKKITNIERAKLGPLAEEQYRVPVPKAGATPFDASAAEAKARHLMDLQNRQGGSAAGPSTSNNSLASGAYEDIDMPSTSAKAAAYAPQSTATQYAAAAARSTRGGGAGSVTESEHPYSTIDDNSISAQNSSYFELPPISPRTAPPTTKPPALPKLNGVPFDGSNANPFGNDDFTKQSAPVSSRNMPKPLSPKRFS